MAKNFGVTTDAGDVGLDATRLKVLTSISIAM